MKQKLKSSEIKLMAQNDEVKFNDKNGCFQGTLMHHR